MTIDELFKIPATRRPNHNDIAAACTALGDDLDVALNTIALTLARKYDSGLMGFGDCDIIANTLFNWAALNRDRGLPQPAIDVFHAFDEGEYHHNTDSPEVDPEEKYTRPMIKEVFVHVRPPDTEFEAGASRRLTKPYPSS